MIDAEEGRDSQTPLPEPPHLWHDRDYVIRTWMEHKIHHTYPRPGGYDDQDEYLMLDWHTMNLYYSRVKAGVFTSFDLSRIRVSSRRAWSDMAGE